MRSSFALREHSPMRKSSSALLWEDLVFGEKTSRPSVRRPPSVVLNETALSSSMRRPSALLWKTFSALLWKDLHSFLWKNLHSSSMKRHSLLCCEKTYFSSSIEKTFGNFTAPLWKDLHSCSMKRPSLLYCEKTYFSSSMERTLGNSLKIPSILLWGNLWFFVFSVEKPSIILW